MRMFTKVFSLRKLEIEAQEKKDEIIEEIEAILTKETGFDFECSDSENDYVYFDGFKNNEHECSLKINFYMIRIIYVDTNNKELKEKLYQLFEKGLDI